MSRVQTSPIACVKWVVAVCLLLPLAGCDESRDDLTKVDSEKEANRILVELEGRGIKGAQKVEKSEQRKTSWAITVPSNELSSARNIIVECDLPRETHNGFAAIADSTSLIPTKGEERAKLIHAICGELERTFETYDRVVSSRVQIAMPEKDPLSREATTKPAATAMVLIKYRPLASSAVPSKSEMGSSRGPSTRPNDDVPVTMEDVQQMVSRSVDGLTTQNVFVTYTTSAPRAIGSVVPAVSNSGSTTATPAASPSDKKLTTQLFIAVAVFGLISIILTSMLAREKRRQRTAVPQRA